MDIKKLTIEINSKPITPLLRILADGKPIGRLKAIKINADDDDILVDIQIMQTKTIKVDGKDQVVTEPLILKWRSGQ
jgi:hypothetical protein